MARSYGHNPEKLPIAVHSWGYIAETDEDARREFFPSLKAHQDVLGQERGWPSLMRMHSKEKSGRKVPFILEALKP